MAARVSHMWNDTPLTLSHIFIEHANGFQLYRPIGILILMDEHPLGLEFELFVIASLAHHQQPPTCTGDNYIEKFFNIPTL